MAMKGWIGLGFDSWALGIEASTVIGMRMTKLATMNPLAAAAEAQLMVSEKMIAAVELQGKAITGQLGAHPAGAARKAIGHYRKAVSKNRRRLSG
jgi:hypothetical protein